MWRLVQHSTRLRRSTREASILAGLTALEKCSLNDALLSPEGLWYSLSGSTDGPPRDTGPPRLSAIDVCAAVEPHFEILDLRATTFDRDRHSEIRAWVLTARRRVMYPR